MSRNIDDRGTPVKVSGQRSPEWGALLSAARIRLDWILEEYGEDDIDYQTFGPIIAFLEAQS